MRGTSTRPRARRRLAAATRAAVLLTAPAWFGCSDATGPDLGRVPIEPPALYRSYWTAVEACSGLTGVFEEIRWFVVHEFGDGSGILGQWNERREITVRSDVWLDGDVVRHEILHDLLRGDRDHDRREWVFCGLDRGVPEGTASSS
ncbi:MAG: hypothetical protein KJO11_01345 [Gemmatimonadetes bacterium]|nr:hypothetical protein [Gemmatimonadota bacterium]MBT8404472.1 hypothetical protein [Gemmatimonadota bacterium]NNF37158.1 hypothetical protein [Gemmatimonadota bacterium]NNK61606.1 hypothetical protein [Gemmatimonadota bacterium]